MAILDTLIIQLDLDGSALGKGVAQARQSLIGLEQQAERTAQRANHALHTRLGQAADNGAASFRRFRQEAMGALALFTGGRSLAGLGPDITLANTGLNASANQSNTLPTGIKDLHKTTPGLTPLPSLPDTPTGDTQALDNSAQNRPSTSADTTSPAQHGTLPTPGPLADWADLLHQASDTTRQALQEVEPSLHNAQQAMARFKQSYAHNQTDVPSGPSGQPQSSNPVSSLLDLSALLTARSILTAGHTHQPEEKAAHTQAGTHTAGTHATSRATGTEIPSWQPGTERPIHSAPNWQGAQNTLSPHTPTGNTAPSPAPLFHNDKPHPATTFATHQAPSKRGTAHGGHQTLPAQPGTPTRPGSHPEHGGSSSPQLTQLAQTLRRLNQTLARHWGLNNTAPPGSPQLTALPSAFTRLLRQIDAAIAPRHVTTHNNTTHSPTVNVVVNGGGGSPAEIGRMARQGTAEALQRYQTGRVG